MAYNNFETWKYKIKKMTINFLCFIRNKLFCEKAEMWCCKRNFCKSIFGFTSEIKAQYPFSLIIWYFINISILPIYWFLIRYVNMCMHCKFALSTYATMQQ